MNQNKLQKHTSIYLLQCHLYIASVSTVVFVTNLYH